MNEARFKSNKTGVYFCVILVLSMHAVLAVPSAVVAQDDNTVETLRKIGKTFAAIAEKTSPSVVVLTVDKPIPRELPDNKWHWHVESFGRQPVPLPEPPGNPQPIHPNLPSTRPDTPRIQKPGPKAQELGFIMSNDGYILTCNHIVKGAKKINAELADGREFEAEIVGTDPDTDIAVVKIDANNMPVLKLGDSDALEVGNWVVGISNTMGLGRAFARGLVTAKNRRGLGMTALEDYLQTSINLQVGDAGGPLLDLDGNVVGIYFARFDGERGGGISFAIPSNMAKDIYEQLIKTGTVERGFLGIGFQDMSAKIAKALDLKTTDGVLVQNIIKDSAADKAGLKSYDVLVELNGKPIESATGLLMNVAALKPGTQVGLVVLRDGQRQNLTVTLGKRPTEQEIRSHDAPKEP